MWLAWDSAGRAVSWPLPWAVRHMFSQVKSVLGMTPAADSVGNVVSSPSWWSPGDLLEMACCLPLWSASASDVSKWLHQTFPNPFSFLRIYLRWNLNLAPFVDSLNLSRYAQCVPLPQWDTEAVMHYLYGVLENYYDYVLHSWERESKGILILQQVFCF